MKELSGVPRPPIGSPRYFMLLYAPRPRRAGVATLLAVADEIDAGLTQELDHAVAHARLAWWGQEAERFAAGQPQHPWLLAWQQRGLAPVALAPLINAAAVDLATASLKGRAGSQLGAALMQSLAELLGVGAPSSEERQQLVDLGRRIAALERQLLRVISAGAASAAEPAGEPLVGDNSAPREPLSARLQPPLAPLLVWAALAAHAAGRLTRRASGRGSRLTGVTDNLRAWRVARRAARGRFTMRLPEAES